ncbi:MAG: hypothetical protein E7642_02570 [Ruminococcaceae bacterium]|nr:hypothetical protein [Oscillospiraceae bacterium]
MKKFLIAICLLMAIVLLSACASEKLEYTIYADFSAEETSLLESKSSSIPIKSATEKVFSFSTRKEIDRHASAVDNYTFSVDGKTYSIPFNESYETAANASEKVRKFGQYNRYLSVTDGYILETNIETKEIELFIGSNSELQNAKGNLTEAQAKEKADAIITEMYGAEVFNGYKHKNTLASKADRSEEQDGYSVTYQRSVFGYPTSDDITISLNMNGDLLAVNAKGKGMLANAEKDITKEQIDNAIKAVEENFSDSWSVHESSATIVMDSEGDYYVRMGISRNTDGMVTAVQVYINVE